MLLSQSVVVSDKNNVVTEKRSVVSEQVVPQNIVTQASEPTNVSDTAIQQEHNVEKESSEINTNSDGNKHDNKSKASDYIT